MPTLLIKTRNGQVFRGQYPLHAIMVMEMGIDPDEVIDKGIVVKGPREVWIGKVTCLILK